MNQLEDRWYVMAAEPMTGSELANLPTTGTRAGQDPLHRETHTVGCCAEPGPDHFATVGYCGLRVEHGSRLELIDERCTSFVQRSLCRYLLVLRTFAPPSPCILYCHVKR